MLTNDQILEEYYYDDDTGIFHHTKDKRGGAKKDQPVLCTDKNGYITISINSVRYKAHRLAWQLKVGFPPALIDHIDGVKTNNKISNLRETTRSLNGQNRTKAASNSASGVLGAFKAKNGKWRSQIRVNGKTVHLGLFNNVKDAQDAYFLAKEKYHDGFVFHPNLSARLSAEAL